MDKTPLETAVDLAGGQNALALALSTPTKKIQQGHIWGWINRTKKAPEEYCPAIESLYGVRCEALRPDLYWTRAETGQVTGHHVRLTTNLTPSPSQEEAT